MYNMCVFCLTSKDNCHFFLRKNDYHPKRVVDFLRGKETHSETKLWKSFRIWTKKVTTVTAKPWKSSRILRVKPNFFIFSVFIIFLHFSSSHFFIFLSFLIFFVLFYSFSFFFLFIPYIPFISFIFLHFSSYFFSFLHFFFFFIFHQLFSFFFSFSFAVLGCSKSDFFGLNCFKISCNISFFFFQKNIF